MPPDRDAPIRELLDRRCHGPAFEAIVAAYQAKVFRLCRSILGDAPRAEDAAQEALLRVWRALETYDGRAALSTWIYAITRNTALSLREYHALRRTDPLEAVAEPAAAAPTFADEDLARAVAALAEPYRRVVMLFYLEGKSCEEVAAMLGIPVGTVKTQLHRARRQLAAVLAGRSAHRMKVAEL